MCLAAGNLTRGLGISDSFLPTIELWLVSFYSFAVLWSLGKALISKHSVSCYGWLSGPWRLTPTLCPLSLEKSPVQPPPQGAVCFSEFLAQALSLSVVTLLPQASVPSVACEAWPWYKSTLSAIHGHLTSTSPGLNQALLQLLPSNTAMGVRAGP